MMKFLCDVHISFKIVTYLKFIGFEAIHVNDILDKSETKDSDICKFADEYDFVVVTKDSDFRDSHFVNMTPKKLIKINLGNISNEKLKLIFNENLQYLEKLKSLESFLLEIEMDDLRLIS